MCNKHTPADLKALQNYPLPSKILRTQTRIMEFYEHYGGKVYIAFSGGLDSTILLDLARRMYPDIPAVFCDTGLEYPENRDFVKRVENVTWIKPKVPFPKILETHGFPIISKDVAKTIKYAKRGSKWAIDRLNGANMDGTQSEFKQRYKKWKFLLEAPFEISDYCCNALKLSPIRQFVRDTGLHAIVGTVADESFQRKQAWLKAGCNSLTKNGKSQPLAFWTRQDILQYHKKYCKLGYSSIYGDIADNLGGQITFLEFSGIGRKLHTTGADRTGCMFCMFGVHLEKEPNRFQRMKQSHPQLYEYCINKLGCGPVLDYIGVKY